MSGAIRLNGFKDDTWINGIGDLFRRRDGVRWGVNLSIFPSKDEGYDATTLSNAPLLRRKTIVNQTKKYRHRYFERSFFINSTLDWELETLKNCPAVERVLPKESNQTCFVFELDDGTTVFIPQFELARALFFHNSYLARSSVIHDVLSNEFIVEYPSDNLNLIINVLETCNCPQEFFNDYGFRRVLAWILADSDARRAYDSIGSLQLMFGRDVGYYRRWNFQFEPPELREAEFKVKGNFDFHSKTLLVYEIESIKNIQANLPPKVEFYSPKFNRSVNGQGAGSGTRPVRPPMHNIDDEDDGSRENKPVILSSEQTEFAFQNAIETLKVCTRKKQKSSGREKSDDPDEASSDVSTEEQGPNGELPSSELDNLNEQTDDAHLYLNKFVSFFKMLELLEQEHGCEVNKFPLRKLPSTGKCTKHMLSDSKNPRCLSLVKVSSGSNEYYLLEVDTSDATKALSTKVINAGAIKDINSKLSSIESELLKSSLSWPKKYLDKLVGKENHSWVPHQKCSNKDAGLTIDEIRTWSQRFYLHLQ